MGRAMEMGEVRTDITRVFSEMKERASGDVELLGQYEKVELPLIFFTDFMIKESNLPFAYDWVELGRERNELAGDEKFFDLLDADLADPGDLATHRLVIFYTCLGLGFTGVYTGQLESIQRMISQISGRISGLMDADKKSHICPEAYENVDTRDLIEPPGAKLIGIAISLIALIVIWAVAYCWLFGWTSKELTTSLATITERQEASSAVE
jgi:type VI protein secretion system component VasF